MKKIFLATPITGLLKAETFFDVRARSSIKIIIDSLRQIDDIEVFCAIEREKYGRAILPADICTKLDLDALASSDVVLAFPGESYGVHIELGWASANEKPIILCLDKYIGSKSPLVDGLGTLNPTATLWFNSGNALPSPYEWTTRMFPLVFRMVGILNVTTQTAYQSIGA